MRTLTLGRIGHEKARVATHPSDPARSPYLVPEEDDSMEERPMTAGTNTGSPRGPVAYI